MQTTLLGLAFAVILALVAALLAPFFVDWTQFRPVFEAEASRMVGMPVHVSGKIDARILPSPSLTLHGLEIGPANDPHALHARSLKVDFALGPLLRGQFRAIEADLVGPDFALGLDKSGAVIAPPVAVAFNPDAFSIERLSIEDGRAHLVDGANGKQLTLDKLWFNGDVRSLAGPFKGEGAFVSSGELYGYRISTGRLGDDRRLRIHLSLDPSDRLLTAEANGTVTVKAGKPRFQGDITLARPAQLIAAAGRNNLELPWRFTSKVDAKPSDAKLEGIDFLYGPQDGGTHLTGTADLRLGNNPLFNGVLSAQQLDLDRLIATRDKPTRLPADALRALVSKFAGAWKPPVPVKLSFSADSLTLGGTSLLLFGADVSRDGDAWTLDHVEFRAPGLTQVDLSGELDVTPDLGFNGPVHIDSKDPNALAAWITGTKKSSAQLSPVTLRGDVVLNEAEVAVTGLQAQVDQKSLHGELHYSSARAGKPPRLAASLSAPELDLDAVMAFAQALRAGNPLPSPDEVTLNIGIGRAKIAGIEAKDVEARVKRNAKLLEIERLSVADLGGARIFATGRIDTSGTAPRGTLALDVDAKNLNGVLAVADKLAPHVAAPLRKAIARVPSAKLHVSLALDAPAQKSAGTSGDARFSIDGHIGGLRASVHGEVRPNAKTAAHGLLAGFTAGDLRVDAQIDGDDGQALIALLGLDKAVAVSRQPGFVNLLASGKPTEAMQVQGRIVAGGLDGKTSGTVRISGDGGPHAELTLDLAKADVRPLAGAALSGEPLPISLRGKLALSKQQAALSEVTGTLAGTDVRGALTLGFGDRLHVDGHIEADTVDAAAMIASAIGVPSSDPSSTKTAAQWSAEPYGPGRFGDFSGRVAVKVLRASLSPSLVAQQAGATLVFDGSEIAIDKFDAKLAGGAIAGRLSFRRTGNGLSVHARLEGAGLDAATMLPADARPVIDGRVTATLDLEATGRSPRALIGSLNGTGSLRLEDGYFSSLDPKAFDTAIRASDQGLAIDAVRVHDMVAAALDSGRLHIPKLEATLTINAGQVRTANASAETDGINVAASGNVDLLKQTIDAHLTLTGMKDSDPSAGHPDIFIGLQGPVARPRRTIDVSALAGWLTIRRIDQQAKKLESLEAARNEALSKQAAPPAQPSHGASKSGASASPGENPPTASSTPPPPSTTPRKPDGGSASTRAAPARAAPPLPKPVEIPRYPRPLEQKQGEIGSIPSVPEWLRPSTRPSVMDSLVSTPHQR